MSGFRSVPVTIVTGFLGSGKTTLLKYVLSANHGKRIAVIENEFGDEKGIEKLIARTEDEQGKEGQVNLGDLFVELSNGCICCTVRDDLVVTLEALLEKREKFDYIMIETTGVADPGPLVGVFWLDEELGSQLYLDGVITVVDLLNLTKHLDDPRKQKDSDTNYINEAHKQIAYADRVLLNKRDLVEDSQYKSIADRVKEINPFASSITTEFSRVDLDQILNVRGYESIPDMEPSAFQRELLAAEPAHHGHKNSRENGHHHDHNQQQHDPTVKSCVVRLKKNFNLKRFQRCIGELLWEQKEQEIFRIKGCISIDDSEKVHIIQAVHETFEVEPSGQSWGDGEFQERQSKIVFIGRNLNVQALTQLLQNLQQH